MFKALLKEIRSPEFKNDILKGFYYGAVLSVISLGFVYTMYTML
jgi:hypothetical protein